MQVGGSQGRVVQRECLVLAPPPLHSLLPPSLPVGQLSFPGNAVEATPPPYLFLTQAGLWNAIALDALLGDSTQLDSTLLAALQRPSAPEGEVPPTVRGLSNPWLAPCSSGGGDHGLEGCDTFQVW